MPNYSNAQAKIQESIFDAQLSGNRYKFGMILNDFSNYTEFRFESPISISKLNNYSDFGRKSGNYFNAKIFIKYSR